MKQIFLFTDIEGSTKLWEKDSEAMSRMLVLHDKFLSEVIPEFGGVIVKHTGDGVFAVFNKSSSVLSCVVKLQKAFTGIGSDRKNFGIKVRMGLHYGFAEKRGGDFFGPAVNLTQRVMDAGCGGQVLVTEEITNLYQTEKGITFQDLGVQRLRNLSTPRRLFLLQHPDIPECAAVSLKTLNNTPNNLQRPMTPFIGREKELHRICTLLKKSSCRILTLHGPGGTGKTRLALQSAAIEIVEFADGVFFINLTKIHSAEHIFSRVAEAIGLDLKNLQNLEDSVIDSLKELDILFVLDNYEHLVSSTDFPRRVVAETSGVKLLITSREKLRLSAENVVEIRGMSTSQESNSLLSDSEELYYETAERVSGRKKQSGNAEVVAEICRQLSGSPLAIVLAASWDGVLSPSEILCELKKSYDLSSNLADIPDRHNSLKAVFLFSWNILGVKEQNLLCCLTIFQRHFTRSATEQVCSIGLKDLTSLVSKSLIDRHEDGSFGIHELTRSFAAEKFKEVLTRREADLLASRHSRFFLDQLKEHEDDLLAGNRGSALQELSGSLEDILAAWRFAFVKRDFESLESSCHGLRVLLALMGMYSRGEAIFAHSANLCESSPNRASNLLKAWLISYRGWFSSYFHHAETSIVQLKKSVVLFREQSESKGLASALNMLGNVYYVSGEYDSATSAYNESLSIRRVLKDDAGVSAVLNNLGNLACQRMDYIEATNFYQESLEKDKALGNQHGVSASLSNLAIVAINQDQLKKAENYLSVALEIEENIGDKFNSAIVRGILCQILLAKEEFDQVETICLENLNTFYNVGNSWGTADALCSLGIMETLRCNMPDSARYFLKALQAIHGKEWTPKVLEIFGAVVDLFIKAKLFQDAYSLAVFVMKHQSSQAELRSKMINLITAVRKQTSLTTAPSCIKLHCMVETTEKLLQGIINDYS